MAVLGGDEQACLLCREERLTEWFADEECCWIAECEQCYVPMVVWRSHDPSPAETVRADLISRLGAVVEQFYDFPRGFYVDDNMRSIPDHYHAHARPVGGFFGHGMRRRGRMPG